MNKSDIHILVVEDEEIIRTMFQQTFENYGFQVDVAENGKDALDKCQEKNNYHIVVTDLNMPVMNGMELLKRLKSKWPFLEVIVITGFATIESAIEAMKLGAYDFILKPVNFDHVQFTMNKCFQKIRAEAENTELRKLNVKLKELNELKDKFLYITNHEIRTPLTIIKGYLDILHTLLPESDSETEEILEILDNTTIELNDMVERMHMLGDLEQMRLTNREDKVDLKELLGKVHKEILGLYNSRNIELHIQMDKNPIFVLGDYRQMRLVLRELLQNALKFTPNGGKVQAWLNINGDHIEYTVKDNGVGIPYDKHDLIFERFYEVQDVIHHKSSTNEFMGGGIGIGLSLVKEIVNSIGGEIRIESEIEQGTMFKVVLPMYQENEEVENRVVEEVSDSE